MHWPIKAIQDKRIELLSRLIGASAAMLDVATRNQHIETLSTLLSQEGFVRLGELDGPFKGIVLWKWGGE